MQLAMASHRRRAPPTSGGLQRIVALAIAVTVLTCWGWPAKAFRTDAFVAAAKASSRRTALIGSIMVPAATAVLPASSLAAEVPPWQGIYEDPEHPGCKREVRVKGLEVKIEGADGRPGCGNGEKEREWNVVGRLSLSGYNEMILDYRGRGGAEKLKVFWYGNGILFPEGIKWTKKGTLTSP
eukprot:gb/GFBE01078211.1/.p1 GENE.gb/GFBE01078211.1/~~gb/GFBE01078211.1/.p1  ORF type:complete len:182 (+),score=39.69 gb/GFBE01078211.1/:1-546(+)